MPTPPNRSTTRVLALLASSLLVLIVAMPAAAYLDAPAERLTLPQLVKEFKSIEVVEAQSVDAERGVVVWRRVDRLKGEGKAQGKAEPEAAPIKHLIKLRGKVPEALGGLKVGRRAVFFSLDGFGRGLLSTDGCWYVVGHEPDSGWWRIAYTDLWYDFNTCYCGDPATLAAAVRRLAAGEEVVVTCRVRAKGEAVQSVRYSMKRPKEKAVVGILTTRPATGPTSRPER